MCILYAYEEKSQKTEVQYVQGQVVVCLFQEHFQRLPREGKSFISSPFVSLLKSSTA